MMSSLSKSMNHRFLYKEKFLDFCISETLKVYSYQDEGRFKREVIKEWRHQQGDDEVIEPGEELNALADYAKVSLKDQDKANRFSFFKKVLNFSVDKIKTLPKKLLSTFKKIAKLTAILVIASNIYTSAFSYKLLSDNDKEITEIAKQLDVAINNEDYEVARNRLNELEGAISKSDSARQVFLSAIQNHKFRIKVYEENKGFLVQRLGDVTEIGLTAGQLVFFTLNTLNNPNSQPITTILDKASAALESDSKESNDSKESKTKVSEDILKKYIHSALLLEMLG